MMAKKKKTKRPTPPPPPARKAPAEAAVAGPTKKQLQREARARRQRREALRRKLVSAGLALTAIAAIALYFVLDRRSDNELREALTSGTCEVDTESDPTAPQGQNHVQNPQYRVNPPAGGDHLANVANAGVYQGNEVPPDGLLVHSLEHGYVIAWHRPDLAEEQKEQLAEFQARHSKDVLLVERPGLPVPVAATAWGHRLLCQQVEPEVLDRFFDERVGDGPEDVARG